MINMLFYKIRTARLLYKRSCSKHEQQTTINSYEKLFPIKSYQLKGKKVNMEQTPCFLKT